MLPVDMFDFEYEFKEEGGLSVFPEGTEEELIGGQVYYRLPNGKYAPSGCYKLNDEMNIIYEPRELSFSAWLDQNCTVKE